MIAIMNQKGNGLYQTNQIIIKANVIYANCTNNEELILLGEYPSANIASWVLYKIYASIKSGDKVYSMPQQDVRPS